jgi:hypothetical protein
MKTMIHRCLVVLHLPGPIGLLVSVVQAILQAMTGNARFPTPTPTLATVAAALADLVKADAVAQTRAKGTAAARTAKRAILVQLVDALAGYVQGIADADAENAAVIIQSAGMAVRKTPVRVKRTFDVIQGAVTGSVRVTAPVVAHRASYDWQWSTDGGKTWQSAPSTMTSKTTLSGFAAGSTVSFRFRANTKAGEGDWSQTIAFLVK